MSAQPRHKHRYEDVAAGEYIKRRTLEHVSEEPGRLYDEPWKNCNSCVNIAMLRAARRRKKLRSAECHRGAAPRPVDESYVEVCLRLEGDFPP